MLSSSDSAYTSLLAKTTCRDILMQNSHNSWQDLIISIFKPAFIDIVYSTLITVASQAAAFKKLMFGIGDVTE